jgi:RNA polymerase sigma-70 factor (ECF subfamily)
VSTTSCDDDFSTFAAVMRPRLLATARRRFANAADAEDAVQETLCRAWARRRSFDSAEHRANWAFRTLVALAVDHRRAAGTRLVDPRGELDESLFDPAPSAADAVLATERRASVGAALRTLEPEQRRLLVDRECWGRSYADIATDAGTTEAALRKRRERSLRLLVRHFERVGAPALLPLARWTRARDVAAAAPACAVLAGAVALSVVSGHLPAPRHVRPAAVAHAPRPDAALASPGPVAGDRAATVAVAQVAGGAATTVARRVRPAPPAAKPRLLPDRPAVCVGDRCVAGSPPESAADVVTVHTPAGDVPLWQNVVPACDAVAAVPRSVAECGTRS